MFLRVFSSGPLATNAILVACLTEKKAAIFDPALGSAELLLREIDKEEWILEAIFLTHSHWDHLADLYTLRQATDAPLYVHAADAENVEHPGQDRIPLPLALRGVKPDGLLQGGQKMKIGRLDMEVIHTPGHSPGGVSFFFPKEKILLSGDTLFAGTFGALRLPTADPTAMWHSLCRLATLPKETRVIPGHGKETTIGHEGRVFKMAQNHLMTKE